MSPVANLSKFLEKSGPAQLGEIRPWATGPKGNPLEYWRKEADGWQRVSQGASGGGFRVQIPSSVEHLLGRYTQAVISGDQTESQRFRGQLARYPSLLGHVIHPQEAQVAQVESHVDQSLHEYGLPSVSASGAWDRMEESSAYTKERDEELQATADNVSIDRAYEAYKKRDVSWVDCLIKGKSLWRGPRWVANWINSRVMASRVVKGLYGFGGYRAKLTRKVKGFPFLGMDLCDKDGEIVSSDFSRMFKPEISESLKDDYDTIDFSNPSLSLVNASLTVRSPFKGNGWVPAMYVRQEDFLRGLTDHLDNGTKRNVVTEMTADVNVGKYFWMTQGFRYAGKNDRDKHLKSLIHGLDALRKQQEDGTAYEKRSKGDGSGMFYYPKDKDGKVLHPSDVGYSDEDLLVVRDALFQEYKKNKDSSTKNDDLIEPWEVLQLEPRLSSRDLHIDNEEHQGREGEAKYIPSGLMKFLSLNGSSWEAIKHVHGPTERDREGIAAGDKNRAKTAINAFKKGNGRFWSWLGDGFKSDVLRGSSVEKSLQEDESLDAVEIFEKYRERVPVRKVGNGPQGWVRIGRGAKKEIPFELQMSPSGKKDATWFKEAIHKQASSGYSGASRLKKFAEHVWAAEKESKNGAVPPGRVSLIMRERKGLEELDEDILSFVEDNPKEALQVIKESLDIFGHARTSERKSWAYDKKGWQYHLRDRGVSGHDPFVKKNEDYIQGMWDAYGLVVVPPKGRQGDYEIPREIGVEKKLMAINEEVMDVRRVLAPLGIGVSFDPALNRERPRGGHVGAVYDHDGKERTIHIVPAKESEFLPSFLHELFRAIDHKKGSGRFASSPEGDPTEGKVVSSFFYKLGEHSDHSDKHLAQHHKSPQEKFARLFEQVSSYGVPGLAKKIEKKPSFWSRGFIASHAKKIDEIARLLGIEFKPEVLYRAQNQIPRGRDIYSSKEQKEIEETLKDWSHERIAQFLKAAEDGDAGPGDLSQEELRAISFWLVENGRHSDLRFLSNKYVAEARKQS